MSRRKGLSHDEKRQKMIELLNEKNDFFQLKELERLGAKEKGVISQAVKDVIQSLVDDGLVDMDKIGTSIYFWAFQSKASNIRLGKISHLQRKLNETNTKFESIKKKSDEVMVGREESNERVESLRTLRTAQSERERLTGKLQTYRDCHPDLLKRLENESKVSLEAANRWTDNIFSIKSWCRNKFFIEENILNKQFNIPEELDYL